MTLGGLALGIGMLVDSTIVMLENLYRHQRQGESPEQAADEASREVISAIVAATSTNLAAVLPFLFTGGLIGLLLRELIFTIPAAILSSILVALTLVPALAGQVPVPGRSPAVAAEPGYSSRSGRLWSAVGEIVSDPPAGHRRLCRRPDPDRPLAVRRYTGIPAQAGRRKRAHQSHR